MYLLLLIKIQILIAENMECSVKSKDNELLSIHHAFLISYFYDISHTF